MILKKEVKLLKKRSCCLVAVFLVSIMLCSMGFTATGQISNAETWQPPKEFVDPVTLKIQEFKSQGLDDEHITLELAKLGMGWYPETGATWIGRALTLDELAQMPPRTPEATLPATEESITLQIGRLSIMRTSSASWTGVSSEVVSGSMSVASGQTRYHYICVQLGGLNGGGTNWVETVLTHNLGEAYRWNTYDSDEGGWSYYMNKNTPITSADTYVIMLDGTHDGYGWLYDVWINYQWVRRGHLSSLWVQAGFQKEVYSDSGQFTNDASHAVFYRNWLHNAQGWLYWTSAMSTWWSTSAPVREAHSMGATSYRWETWVQN
jgi:hypothetical protein